MQLYIQFFFLKALIIQGWNIYCVISGVVVNGFTVKLMGFKRSLAANGLLFSQDSPKVPYTVSRNRDSAYLFVKHWHCR